MASPQDHHIIPKEIWDRAIPILERAFGGDPVRALEFLNSAENILKTTGDRALLFDGFEGMGGAASVAIAGRVERVAVPLLRLANARCG